MDKLNEVLEKSNKLNEKSGPFDCVLLSGDVLKSDDPTLSVKIQQPTFFTNGKTPPSQNSGSKDIAENFTLLNNYGIYAMSNGLKIAYLPGNEESLNNQRESIVETFKNVEEEGADILMTYHWSNAISSMEGLILGHDLIDEVVKLVKPKYHFTCGYNKFFELQPFGWSNERVTRFINIAEYGSGSKWAYAFNIELDSDIVGEPSESLIANPYLTPSDKKRSLSLDLPEKPIVSKKPKQILPIECRFCFSNPNLEDHLIISISEHAYLTVAKGPLSIPKGKMDFSGHCLIIPIEHIPKLNPKEHNHQDISETPTGKDVLNFERSIAEMNDKKYDMATIVFEINSEHSIHFHKQIVPVPKYLMNNFESALDRQVHFNNDRYTNNARLNFVEFSDANNEEYLKLINNCENNYIQFTVYESSGSTPKKYITTFESRERIDLQFGRRVVAYILRLPKRTKWDSKPCQQTIEQEKRDVDKFQKGFKEYDFTN